MNLSRQVDELFRHEQWNIGVVRAPIAAFLDPAFLPQVEWAPSPPKSMFRADPFGMPTSAGLEVLCEEFDQSLERGHLARFDPVTGVTTRLEGFPSGHLSYPYVLEVDGEIFCLPEMVYLRQVRLYRASSFPLQWEHVATLLEDSGAVDATPFCHEGRWWMAAANADTGAESDLCLWHAPAITGPWHPHRANPVKRDAASARPGGTPFHHAGNLYRPAQDCSERYGGAIVLNHVTRLTPDEFEERPVRHWRPEPDWRWPHGCHTLSAAGEVTLVDAVGERFVAAAFRRVLRRKFCRLCGYTQ